MSVVGDMVSGKVGKRILIAAFGDGYENTGSLPRCWAGFGVENILHYDQELFSVQSNQFVCKKAGDYLVRYYFKLSRSNSSPQNGIQYTVQTKRGTTTTNIANGSKTSLAVETGSSVVSLEVDDLLYAYCTELFLSGQTGGIYAESSNVEVGIYVTEA